MIEYFWLTVNDIKMLSPGGCLPLPRGYIHVLNQKKKKKLYKISLQRDFFWNLQQMTEVTRCSCWHQNFVPKGLSAPVPGLYTCIKSWKKCIKSDFKEIFLKLVANDRSDKRFLLTSKFCPLMLSPLNCGYYSGCWTRYHKSKIHPSFERIILISN